MNQTKYPRKVSTKWKLKMYYDDVSFEKSLRTYNESKRVLIQLLKENKINQITKITITRKK